MAIRVLILVPQFPLEKEKIKGGVHAAILNLLLGFEPLDIVVRVVSIDPYLAENRRDIWNDHIEVQYCRVRKFPVKMLSYLIDGPAVLKQQIRDFAPDIIHYQIGGNFYLTNFGVGKTVPFVQTIHGISLEEAKVNTSLRKKLTMYWNGYVNTLLRPKNIINISAYSKAIVNIPDNRNHPIIYNAVSQAFFEVPLKVETENRLLYIGVINERKNLMTLLEAMARLKEEGILFQLSVVGGADHEKGYFELVNHFASKRLEGQVEFLGWKSQVEIPKLLASHDIIVLPSRQETLPMSVAEAMAAGKVVVSSRVGGLPEMIQEGLTGFLFDPFNAGELRDALAQLYNNQELIRITGNNARSFAREKFDNHQIARQTLAYYEEVISRHKAAPKK